MRDLNPEMLGRGGQKRVWIIDHHVAEKSRWSTEGIRPALKFILVTGLIHEIDIEHKDEEEDEDEVNYDDDKGYCKQEGELEVKKSWPDVPLWCADLTPTSPPISDHRNGIGICIWITLALYLHCICLLICLANFETGFVFLFLVSLYLCNG